MALTDRPQAFSWSLTALLQAFSWVPIGMEYIVTHSYKLAARFWMMFTSINDGFDGNASSLRNVFTLQGFCSVFWKQIIDLIITFFYMLRHLQAFSRICGGGFYD